MASCVRSTSGASLLLFLSFVLAVNAQNTTAGVTVGWEAGPNGRGTLSLVWGCVLTIFACTWTVLHLNVPGLDERWWWILLRKIKWMAITILFPEFIFSKAVCDLRLALEELREFDEHLQNEGRDIRWTMVGGIDSCR